MGSTGLTCRYSIVILPPEPDMSAPDPGSPSFVQTLQRLRSLSQQDCQPHWQYHSGDLPLVQVLDTGSSWPTVTLNDRQHVAWARGRQVLWLYQRLHVPPYLRGYALAGLTLRLSLVWWADDAQIFVNGELARCGDLFDYFTRLCLTPQAISETVYTLAIRLVSPGHDDGALVRSRLLYEVTDSDNWPSPEPGFVADELAALGHYVQALAPDRMTELETATNQIDWSVLDGKLELQVQRRAFHQSLAQVRQQLSALGQWVRQRQISCTGHAHLDMAWLWPVADTWQAAERTFESVLRLQQDFPELTYTHSSPALFAWLEANRPELFNRVQQQVKAGRWSIDAGLWIEPELNIISGEAIARQILYGQRYCQDKFGTISTIAWLPDTFGFCHQLPQLLKLGGIEVFATQKLRWNDTTQFPYELFEWVGPDESRVLGWTLPPIGTDFDPVQIAEYAAQWEAQTGLPHAFWLPGVGDHGGGPTREMLETARRWAESPLFPQVGFTQPGEFVGAVRACLNGRAAGVGPSQGDELSRDVGLRESVGADDELVKQGRLTRPTGNILPQWNDELYLELHRGCYTTHADQKRYNRRCEDLLYEAELWATLAQRLVQHPYPKAQLEQAWKMVLFNQFHDILPGSAIPEVFEDANCSWREAKSIAEEQLSLAVRQITKHCVAGLTLSPDAHPLIVFNALNWSRTEVVGLPDAGGKNWQIYDGHGQLVPCQPLKTELTSGSTTELVSAEDTLKQQSRTGFRATVPAVGYAVYWCYPSADSPPIGKGDVATTTAATTTYDLENVHLHVSICAKTGEILSLFDRAQQREVLSSPANQLQIFADSGQYWDAWNIAPDYEAHPLPAALLESVTWLERGPLRQRLQVQRRLGQSRVTQVYCLEAGSPLLKIETEVDWWETQVLLKVNFPTAFSADAATYEAPFGATVRSTHTPPPGPVSGPAPDSVADSEEEATLALPYASAHAKTKWEVPALRWADLTDPDLNYGLSILTDGKHGFDARPNQLRLTLLKAPLWPDPEADRGVHRFTYALFPHAGSWQQAKTVEYARALNVPLRVCEGEGARNLETSAQKKGQSGAESGGSRGSFLKVKNAVLAALKPAEDGDGVILRCYDATGEGISPEFESSLGLELGAELDVLERPLADSGGPRPYQIWTYRLNGG